MFTFLRYFQQKSNQKQRNNFKYNSLDSSFFEANDNTVCTYVYVYVHMDLYI